MNTKTMKPTLASIPGITVSLSPYRDKVFRVKPEVKPRDIVVYEKVFLRFLQAPMFLDGFGEMHDVRRAFWRGWGARLSPEDDNLVRHNPLKWGVVSAIIAMIPVYDIPARAIDLSTYHHMCQAEKVAYVEELRCALVILFD